MSAWYTVGNAFLARNLPDLIDGSQHRGDDECLQGRQGGQVSAEEGIAQVP
jgi:hypothetical protein